MLNNGFAFQILYQNQKLKLKSFLNQVVTVSVLFNKIILSKSKIVSATRLPRLCPYLDTINRQYLDFDFEKLCSVSLTRINVYACLVCGKYFQGRGTNTHAYTHSVAEGHHVFLNLQTLKFYCLPDNYEIIGKIIYVLSFQNLLSN